MKAVVFPPANPLAVPSCPLSTSSNPSGETGAFAQVMDHAMGGTAAESETDADAAADSKSDAPVAKPVQKEISDAAPWLATLIVPMLSQTIPTVPSVATACTAETADAENAAGNGNAVVSLPISNGSVVSTDSRSNTALISAEHRHAHTNQKLQHSDARTAESIATDSDDTSAATPSSASNPTANVSPGIPNLANRADNNPLHQPGGAFALSGVKLRPEISSEALPTELSEDSTASAEFSGTNPAGQTLPPEARVERPAHAHPGREAALPSKPIIPAGSALPSTFHGTSAAKYVSPNQKAENMNEFTGSSEQNLPGKATLDAPGMAKSRTAPPFTSPKSDEVDATEFHAPEHGTRTGQVTSTGVAAPISHRTLDRAEDLMALHALRLRDSGLESMRVVIKPDVNLHLALTLQMRDNAVEITAQLQRGDHEALSRHWPELQQQMEQRGIRVAPLTQSEPNTNSSNSQNNNQFSHDSRRQQNEERPTHSGAFAEFALDNVLVPKRTARSSAPRGWESWA